MGQKWFFNKCFSWTGPGLCSSRLPPLPLPFFPLALRFFGNFVLIFSFSVVEILLSSFYFLFGKYAVMFFNFRFEILLSGFYFLFWNFCSQGYIFHFESCSQVFHSQFWKFCSPFFHFQLLSALKLCSQVFIFFFILRLKIFFSALACCCLYLIVKIYMNIEYT